MSPAEQFEILDAVVAPLGGRPRSSYVSWEPECGTIRIGIWLGDVTEINVQTTTDGPKEEIVRQLQVMLYGEINKYFSRIYGGN